MRVLLVHNHYRSDEPSGEGVVFRNERRLLEENGIDVVCYERSNDEIPLMGIRERLALARNAAWSPRTHRELTDLIRRTEPAVAHFHNTFPLISPSAYAACRRARVAVVQTLHNYRLICPAASLRRSGRVCEDCVGATLAPALRYRCYKGSLAATAAVVGMLVWHRRRRTYRTLVNRYVALTQFAAGKLVEGGLPRGRIVVKPNFLPDPPPVRDERGEYALFVGRLGEEKGLGTLVAAWKHVAGLPLKVVGDGALREELAREAARNGAAVEFLGFRPRDEVMALVGAARFQLIPSECYENFPVVLLEAYACGTPVVASRIGSLAELVVPGETGVTFAPGNAQELAAAVNALREDRQALERMRRGCRRLFTARYGAAENFRRLREIYESARCDLRTGP
jgi:glycosyltransferase involved in cell wall biosynthesis